jgi:hypothetical protein
MFRPHNAYSGNSTWIKCTLPWSFLYIRSDIRILQPLNDHILSLMVHSYQYDTDRSAQRLVFDKIKVSNCNIYRKRVSYSTALKQHSRKWYLLWRSSHGLFENWSTLALQRPNSVSTMMWLAQHGEMHAYCAEQCR